VKRADDPVDLRREEVASVRATYLERTAIFQSHGYDRQGSARFIIDEADLPAGLVLDVGTGKGVQAVALAHRGLDVVTVDPDPEQLRFAKLNAEAEGIADRIRFVRADGSRLPFAAESFGAVFLVDALHHLEEGAPVFAEMARVVRRDVGCVVLAEFDAEGFAIIARVHEAEGRTHPVGPITFDAALNDFRSRGFRLRSICDAQVHRVAVLTPGGPESGSRAGVGSCRRVDCRLQIAGCRLTDCRLPTAD
jgi:ubiquinone/menaquinone biosynthesis C-methylase UbiE